MEGNAIGEGGGVNCSFIRDKPMNCGKYRRRYSLTTYAVTNINKMSQLDYTMYSVRFPMLCCQTRSILLLLGDTQDPLGLASMPLPCKFPSEESIRRHHVRIEMAFVADVLTAVVYFAVAVPADIAIGTTRTIPWIQGGRRRRSLMDELDPPIR